MHLPTLQLTQRNFVLQMELEFFPMPHIVLFGYVKNMMRGRRFSSATEAVAFMEEIIAQIPKKMWSSAFDNWFVRMRKCVDNHGDYIN